MGLKVLEEASPEHMESQVAISACEERRQYDLRKGNLSGVVRGSFLNVMDSVMWPGDLIPPFL